MIFNAHSNLRDLHSFLSPSQYHWIRYDAEKLAERYVTKLAARRGTELHDLAHRLIKAKIRQIKTNKTFNMFVNDVIGFRMQSEQVLFYSENCFGTADAIGFKDTPNQKLLRIFDLKTGDTPAHVEQLIVYAALFCLEYGYKAFELEYDLRIYQSDEIQAYDVDPKDVADVMAVIIAHDNQLNALKAMEED